MDKNIGILHLSDFHINESNKDSIIRLIKLMFEDAISLLSTTNTEVCLVCITGDLINRGQNHQVELDISLTHIVLPIIEQFNINESDVFIVPGNHEVDTTKIEKFSEQGMANILTSSAEIDAFIKTLDPSSLERIEYFNSFSNMFSGKPILENQLYSSYIVEKKGIKLGLALINSAWRSSGKGYIEKNTLVVGQRQMTDCLNSINDTDIKICLMHHPLDWLIDTDKFEVEKCVNDFDIVLNGHIHSLDSKTYNSFNGQTLFNTSGKFDLTSDIFNGYSLITINPSNYHCDVYLRHYHPHPRNCFDKAIHLSENGMLSADLDAKDESQVVAYNTIRSIRELFFKFSNSFFVSNVVDGFASKSFDELFIAPLLNRFSEYEKETMLEKDDYLLNGKSEKDDGEITIEQICGDNKNIFLYGRKEIGKTTLLHYFAKIYLSKYIEYNKIPIIIDCMKQDMVGSRPIHKAISSFIFEFASDDFSISPEQIVTLLEKGKFVIMFDNFETASDKQITRINDFIGKYGSNRYIFSCMESIRSPLIDHKVITSCEYTPIYIRSMTKHQIRTMAENLQPIPYNTETSLVDKMMLCFKNTNLPKTPFVVSLILSICKDNMEFIPVNEAVVMESFLEMLLEKGSANEARRSNFDFRNKEDFLIYLVSYMNTQDRYYLTNQEFQDLLYSYHKDKKFDIFDTKFDIIFFEKGVLIRTTDLITFRYSCIVEYYLAKKAINDPEFLNYILTNERYLNYTRELALYTGLKREDLTVLNAIQPDFQKYVEDNMFFLNELKDYKIEVDISITTDMLNERIYSSRLSIEESDKITDDNDTSEKKAPESISKTMSYEDYDKFLNILLLYGTYLKNSELLSGDVKEKMLTNYMIGLMIWLGKMKVMTEERAKELIDNLLVSNSNDKDIEKIIRRIVRLAEDIIKISLPIMIQNVALENIGTVKMKSVMLSFIDNTDKQSFERFLSLFLYSDLRIKGSMKYIKDFVKDVDNKDLLKITFFKLLYYYQYRYFSAELDNTLENLLADINLKLRNENKFHKAAVMQDIRKMERESINDTWDEVVY